jgi:hypothetical protein
MEWFDGMIDRGRVSTGFSVMAESEADARRRMAIPGTVIGFIDSRASIKARLVRDGTVKPGYWDPASPDYGKL